MCVRGNKPELAPTKVPSTIDIAWAAGVYEGEGSCRNCGKRKKKQKQLSNVVEINKTA